MTTQDQVNYYRNLLILQYLGKARAYATVQAQVLPVLMPQASVESFTFNVPPQAGTFTFTYRAASTVAINWNDPAATVQTKLQAVSGLGAVTVSGSFASQLLVVTMTGVEPIAAMLALTSNLLTAGSPYPAGTVVAAGTYTDLPLAAAINGAFNLTGPSKALGAQLDTLAKYVGVTRTVVTPAGGPVLLNDADFITLIQVAIIRNNSGSSLATIQALLHQFFPNQIFVSEPAVMQVSYTVSTALGSATLLTALVGEHLLPAPMGVQVATTVFSPSLTFYFGFRTYGAVGHNDQPLNSYTSYNMTDPFLSYANGIF